MRNFPPKGSRPQLRVCNQAPVLAARYVPEMSPYPHTWTRLSLRETGNQVSKWLKDNAESKHAAVYAVVGKDEAVNFVGVGRNVALSVAAHLANEGEDMVHLLKVRDQPTDR